ncbi:protocatechuate 3,4-dioxygenase subunit beta [soil metagenome]
MNEQEKIFSRRQMLGMAIGFGGLAAFGSSVFAQQAERFITPEVGMGPFYPMLKPLDKDADLTSVKGQKGVAQGAIVHVAGRVLDLKGKPVAGAKIEIWQANSHGRYAHQSDPNTAPLDPNFQGFAVLTTDSEGRYRFKTIKPGAYPISPTEQRPPHIHFDVEGKANRLVSQMFFPNEPLNEKDALFLDLRSQSEKTAAAVIAQSLPPTKEIEKNAMLLGWDIVLING